MLIMPVANGVLPHPDGGRIKGAFVMEQGGRLLATTGIGQEILICPWIVDEQELYPIGVIARIIEIAEQSVPDPESGQSIPVILVCLEGRGHARWRGAHSEAGLLFAADVERMYFKHSRKEVSGDLRSRLDA